MVDVPFFGKPKGNEQFIFNRDGKLPLSIAIKKIFFKKEMCSEAKKRVIGLCENEKFKEISTVKILLSHINSAENGDVAEVNEAEVIEAFAGVVRYLIPARHEDFKKNIPEELIDNINNQKIVLSPEKLAEEIKLISIEEKTFIAALREKEAFAVLKMYLNETSELKTEKYYNSLLEWLSDVINFIGKPDTQDQEILLSKIRALHTETKDIYNNLVESAIEHKCKTIRSALTTLTKEAPFFEDNFDNEVILQTFLHFVRDPALDLGNQQVQKNLNLVRRELIANLHTLTPATRDICLAVIDKLDVRLLEEKNLYLSGRLLVEGDRYLSFSGEAWATVIQPLMTALREASKDDGPSGRYYYLLHLWADKDQEINQAAYWSLSGLSKKNIASIRARLPDILCKREFSNKINELGKKLKEFRKSQGIEYANHEMTFNQEKAAVRQEASQSDKSYSPDSKKLSQSQSIGNNLKEHNKFIKNDEARARIISAVQGSLKKLPVFNQNEQSRAKLQSFFDFMINQKINFYDDKLVKNINDFLSEFFSAGEILSVDEKKIIMNEIDLLSGMMMVHDGIDYISIKIEEKIINNRKFDLATSLQFYSEEIGPSACMTNFFYYLEKGKDAIDARSFWMLNHLMRFQRSTIIHLLGPQQKSDFDALLGQLKTDLQDFKESHRKEKRSLN